MYSNVNYFLQLYLLQNKKYFCMFNNNIVILYYNFYIFLNIK